MDLFNVLRKVTFGEGTERREYPSGQISESDVASWVIPADEAKKALELAVARGYIEPIEAHVTAREVPVTAREAPVFHVGVAEKGNATDKA